MTDDNTNLKQEIAQEIYDRPNEIAPDVPDTIKELTDFADKGIAEEKTDPEQNSDEWYLTPEIKGIGKKPEFIMNKYDNILAQAKACYDMQKFLGAHTGAPDEYKVSARNPDRFKFNETNPRLKSFLDLAKTNNINQDFVNSVLNLYEDELLSSNLDVQAEIKELGEGYAQKLGHIMQWANNNLSDENADVFNRILNKHGSEAYKMFAELRQSSAVELPAPLNMETAKNVPDTVEALEQEYSANYERIKHDALYRKQWEARLAKVVGE